MKIPASVRGFTLIELLVVISIIGLLSSIVLAALNTARLKGYDAQRASNLAEVQKAVNAYYADTGSYPPPGGGYASLGNYVAQCQVGGNLPTANAMIPDLVPTYISSLPTDPLMNGPANTCCFEYSSDGLNYKYKLATCPTASGVGPTNYLKDPNPGDVNGWAIYSPGAKTF